MRLDRQQVWWGAALEQPVFLLGTFPPMTAAAAYEVPPIAANLQHLMVGLCVRLAGGVHRKRDLLVSVNSLCCAVLCHARMVL